MPPRTNGPSTPMPSVQLDLGRYVTVRPRKEGTARVLFEVPARLRPSDWPKTIPLPVTGARTGNLQDAAEVGRIQQDAKGLLDKLRAARMGREAEPAARSMPALIRSWQSTPKFQAKRPATQKGYSYHAGLIEAWSKSIGHKPVAAITLEAIEQFLAFYDDRPTTRRHVKIVFSMLMNRAIQLRWRSDNPLDTITMGAPESLLSVWEPEDVAFYRAWAINLGQPSIAAMIQTLWETCQRVTDARLFRKGAEYKHGVFRFWQSKTRSYITVRISRALQAELDELADEEGLYLFTDATTGKPWGEQRLGHVFAAIREASGGPPLVLRALRHSGVIQMARAGSDVPEIASVTGHSPFSAAQILRKYLPRDSELAAKAQARRGLIANGSQTT